MSTLLVGVGGQLRNGKDEIADRLCLKLMNAHNIFTDRPAFAHAVKRIFCEAFDVDLDFIEKWKIIPEAPPGFDMSVRKGLQFIGDGFRTIKSRVWLDLAFKNRNQPSIFSDVRYINELEIIKNKGGINVLTWRPGYENNDPNGSEAQIKPLIDWLLSTGKEGQLIDHSWMDADWDSAPEGISYVDIFIKNDGTLDDLDQKIEKIILPYVQGYFDLL